MSAYEDYNTTSKDYDKARHPVGIETVLGSIATVVNGDLSKAVLVDIGCGTANYASVLSQYVGQVTGIEHNSGMLEQAKKKTALLPNVKLLQGDAANIPLPDGYCDAVICTQVIHHFPDSIPPDYPGSLIFFKEAFRILKDKGVIVVNTISKEQAEKGWWVIHIIPTIGDRHKARYAPLNTILDQMKESGLDIGSVVSHCHETLTHPDVFFDQQGIFKQEWRNFDSMWSLLTNEELEEAQAVWKKMINDGSAKAFVEEKDCIRKVIGQTTTVVAYKGLNQ